jgi:hypothetical protein
MSLTVEQAYKNVEKIIVNGFLTASMFYGDTHFLFKNITDKEYANLGYYRQENDLFSDMVYHLSFCTALVNGLNYLEDRFFRIHDLLEFYVKLPSVFVEKIYETIQKLNGVYIESLDYLEGFCYTDRSRHLWQVLDINNRSSFTGIAGVDNVGINSVQENWIIINKRLDDEESYQRELQLSLMVASATNPKGTKSISKSFDQRKTELDELRADIAKYGYDRERVREQQEKAIWTAPLKSRDDLVRELYRQMAGKKDKHDLFMDRWIAEQRAKAEEAKINAEKRQKEFREKFSEAELGAMEESKPVSALELKAKLDKGVTPAGVGLAISTAEHVGERENFLKKISSTVIRNAEKE